MLCMFSFTFSGCGAHKAEAEKAYIAAVDAYGAEKYEEALVFIRQALVRDRKFYQAEFLEGRILFFTGNEAEAKKTFARLVTRHPEYIEARIWYIRTLILNGEYEKAEGLIEGELSFNTSDWRIYYLYALLAQKQKDYEKRLSMGRHAETALRDSAKVYMDMAAAWQALGLEERVKNYLEKASLISGANILPEQLKDGFK